VLLVMRPGAALDILPQGGSSDNLWFLLYLRGTDYD